MSSIVNIEEKWLTITVQYKIYIKIKRNFMTFYINCGKMFKSLILFNFVNKNSGVRSCVGLTNPIMVSEAEFDTLEPNELGRKGVKEVNILTPHFIMDTTSYL